MNVSCHKNKSTGSSRSGSCLIALANNSSIVGSAGRTAFLSAIGVTTNSEESAMTSLGAVHPSAERVAVVLLVRAGAVRPPAGCVAAVQSVGVGAVRPLAERVAVVPSGGVTPNSKLLEKPTSDALSVAGAIFIALERIPVDAEEDAAAL